MEHILRFGLAGIASKPIVPHGVKVSDLTPVQIEEICDLENMC